MKYENNNFPMNSFFLVNVLNLFLYVILMKYENNNFPMNSFFLVNVLVKSKYFITRRHFSAVKSYVYVSHMFLKYL